MSSVMSVPTMKPMVKSAMGLPALLGLVAVFLAVGGVINLIVPSALLMSLLTQAVIFAIFALGVGFLLKQNGMVSFGHALFFGMSGYLVGIGINGLGWSAGFTIVATILVIGFLAFLLALVIVRVHGIAFSMLTLAIGQGFFVVMSGATGMTGGADGMTINFPDRIFGIDLGVYQTPSSMFLLCWAVLVVLIFVLTLLLRTRFGPLTEAIRENEERVRFIGYRTLVPRASVFAISAMITALGGVLSSLYTSFISPESLHWSMSGSVLIMVILGGSRALWGPVVGAVIYYLFRDYLGEHTTHWMGIFGMCLIAVIVLWPSGVAGGVTYFVNRFQERLARGTS